MNDRTSVQTYALIFGIVYALVGLLGFVPGLLQPPPSGAPSLQVDSAYGYLLGIFPVNLLHNLVHLLVGVLGVVSARALNSARAYSRAVAIVFGVLTVMGLLPQFNTTFGLIPLFGSDVALHAVTTVAAAYFGWFASDARRVRSHNAVVHAN
jgi:hypothetical protein